MAAVRIFLLTYKRPQLLQRSLESLLAQTFTDWVCELHNDAPEDNFPAELVARIADPRIKLHRHEKNWGPIASFNHMYAGGPEPFASLLEDDNWWEPTFLETAINALDAAPDASLVWANMKLWREERDGSWTETGKFIWKTSVSQNASSHRFQWPEAMQAFDAVHSNGAMVFRPKAFSAKSVPSAVSLSIVEPLRERSAIGPIILLQQPLANFAITLTTNRGKDATLWAQSQLLIATSFFNAVKADRSAIAQIWATLRATTPPGTHLLFLTGIALRRFDLLAPARPREWLRLFLSVARHPLSNFRALRYRSAQPEVFEWLATHTQPASLRTEPLLLEKRTSSTAS